MTPTIDDHQRRYRRRIIGVGAALFVLTFVIPAPFVLNWVENDLEGRVGDELEAAGVDGVTVRFSGQDGTLECASPLDEPDRIVALAEDEWGVRSLDLAASCRTATTDDSGDTDTDTDTADADDEPTTEAPTTAASTTTPTTVTPTTDAPTLDSISTLVINDPQFSQLAGLLTASGSDATLADDGPFTLFAPTDAAFDTAFETLGPDAFAALTADPELVEQLVLHHGAEGRLASGDLVDGELDMLDGTAVTIAVIDDEVTISSADVIARPDSDQGEVEASNGVVHPIDMVLLPDGLDLEGQGPAEPQARVELVDGRYALVGFVASEAQQATLRAALDEQVDDANVDDRLLIDPDSPVTDDDINRLSALVVAMPPNLASGTVSISDGSVSLTGVVRDDAGRAQLDAAAAEVGAEAELDDPPVADDDAAAVLQDELNDFVRANPITFEPNSADLTEDAVAIVEQVIGRIVALDGIDILIVGHTDSDGQPETNQQLSEERAATVLDALVADGVDAGTLSSEGRGETEPVLVEGVEDKDASRRVEFLVTATT